MAGYIPSQGDLVALTFDPQSGHTVHLERPEEWLRVAKNHLSE